MNIPLTLETRKKSARFSPLVGGLIVTLALLAGTVPFAVAQMHCEVTQ